MRLQELEERVKRLEEEKAFEKRAWEKYHTPPYESPFECLAGKMPRAEEG